MELEGQLAAAKEQGAEQWRQLEVYQRALETRAKELSRQLGGADITAGLLHALAGAWWLLGCCVLRLLRAVCCVCCVSPSRLLVPTHLKNHCDLQHK